MMNNAPNIEAVDHRAMFGAIVTPTLKESQKDGYHAYFEEKE
jgi:hypothetical protein